MASNVRKKERRRLKRQQKKRNLKRAQDGSPYRRIGASSEPVACYINRNWRDAGEASMFVLRRAPGGGHAMGAFLVDIWCTGLKDAWGRLEISYEEFNEGLVRRASRNLELVRVDLDLVKRLVAGGVRLADQNGFRLPPRYKRWVALLGDIGDPASADLSDFGVDGRFRYIGTMEDLERRQVRCSADEFLNRTDVEFIIGPPELAFLAHQDEELEEQEEQEEAFTDDDAAELDDFLERMRQRGLGVVRQWCFAHGEQPHPRLPDAWDLTFESIAQIDGSSCGDEPGEEEFCAGLRNLDRFLSLERPEVEEQLHQALDQLQRWVEQFGSAEAMFQAIGLDQLDHAD